MSDAPERPFAAAEAAAAAGPLARFRVIDLTRIRSGPTAVRQFADWGADVIKVEATGDDSGFGGRDSSDFQNLHRNKRSLTLNLKEPEGREIFLRLIDDADVLVENFRPDVKTRLGIDWDSLHARNPRLVYGSISGFGQDGPYAGRPGFDQVAQGMGGLMSITGLPGQGPVRVGVPIADLGAGLFCAMGIFIALLDREKTGKGRWVRSSLLQAQISLLDFQAARWLIDGEVPGQAGNDHPTATPMGAFETADGHINIAVGGQTMWRTFCDLIGRPDLTDDPDYRTPRDRLANRPALNAIVAEVARGATSAEWVERLNAAGIPCGPIYAMDEVFDDPQVRHLGIVQEVESPTRGRQKLLGQPIDISGATPVLRTATPEAGEHTDAILGDLGYPPDRIADLRARGIV